MNKRYLLISSKDYIIGDYSLWRSSQLETAAAADWEAEQMLKEDNSYVEVWELKSRYVKRLAHNSNQVEIVYVD